MTGALHTKVPSTREWTAASSSSGQRTPEDRTVYDMDADDYSTCCCRRGPSLCQGQRAPPQRTGSDATAERGSVLVVVVDRSYTRSSQQTCPLLAAYWPRQGLITRWNIIASKNKSLAFENPCETTTLPQTLSTGTDAAPPAQSRRTPETFIYKTLTR